LIGLEMSPLRRESYPSLNVTNTESVSKMLLDLVLLLCENSSDRLHYSKDFTYIVNNMVSYVTSDNNIKLISYK